MRVKKILRLVLRTFLALCFGSSLFVLLTTFWALTTWRDLKLDEIAFHLAGNLDGAGKGILLKFILICIVPAVLAAILSLFFLHFFKVKDRVKKVLTIVLSVLTFSFMAISLGAMEVRLSLISYLINSGTESDFIDDNYVDPRQVKISFPEKKRNLIFIFLESMETTYADKESGGSFDANMIPELTKLSKENESFGGNDSERINGGIPLTGSTWTMGAMFSQMTGLPLKPIIEKNSMDTVDRFYPGVISLGDILADEGYKQELILGSDAEFGGREKFFTQHGGYEIFDYYTAVEKSLIPEDYFRFWGYEDSKLFEYAKDELTRLSEADEPFNLTMLTVDTHFEDGFVCDECGTEFGSDQYANVIACSSRQVADFVSWVKKQPFYEDTTIVISGDHLTMDSDFCNDVSDDYKRKVYFTVINGEGNKKSKNERTYATLDVFPTVLEALGAKIDGGKLALGTSLYSGEKTLIERYGQKKCDDALGYKSKLLTELAGSVPISEDRKYEFISSADLVISEGEDETLNLNLYGSNAVSRDGIEKIYGMIYDTVTGRYSDEVSFKLTGHDSMTSSKTTYSAVCDLSRVSAKHRVGIMLYVDFLDGDERVLLYREYGGFDHIKMPEYLKMWDLDEYTLFLAICDEGTKLLSDEDMEALKYIGVDSELKGEYRTSFYAVKGRGISEEAMAHEYLSKEGKFDKGAHTYRIDSAGYDSGNTCSIIIDDKEYAPAYRGINVVVYNNKTDTVEDVAVFDTHMTKGVRSY